MKPILCLDFDGVIHSYVSGWKGARNIPDPPTPGAFAFIESALKFYRVAVFSSRGRYWGGRRAMRKWMIRHAAEYYATFDDIRNFKDPDIEAQIAPWDRCASDLIRQIEFPKHKPPASVSLDDRAVRFNGFWPDLELLQEMKPWNYRPESEIAKPGEVMKMHLKILAI